MHAFLFALATLGAADWFGSDCQEFVPRSALQPAAGVTRVVVIGRAGFLHIEGRNDVSEIRASGTACAPIEHLLVAILLKASRSGSTVTVEAMVPNEDGGLFESGPKLDFTVTLPAGIDLYVADTAGELLISNVRNAKVSDTSGNIGIRNVAGNVTVQDRTGPIAIADVGGNVHIPADSSGSIQIARVRGSVTIDDDGSGSVDISDVGGDFTLRSKGSGAVDYRRVAGHVSIPSRYRHK